LGADNTVDVATRSRSKVFSKLNIRGIFYGRLMTTVKYILHYYTIYTQIGNNRSYFKGQVSIILQRSSVFNITIQVYDINGLFVLREKKR
jgi:hypothetical protein